MTDKSTLELPLSWRTDFKVGLELANWTCTEFLTSLTLSRDTEMQARKERTKGGHAG